MNADQIIRLIEAAMPILAMLFLGILSWKNVSEENKKRIGGLIDASYRMATEIAALTPNKVDDIVAVALGELDKALIAHGYGPATPATKEQARLAYNAISGAEKQAIEIQAKSMLSAASAAVAMSKPSDPTPAPANS
jgi:hypothetical protein